MEQWRDVPRYGGRYQVSDQGRVRALGARAKVLKPQLINSGYFVVHLYQEGKRRIALVHRLVARVFTVAIGYEVNHGDGVKTNNTRENLAWTDRQGNVDHALAVGLHHRCHHFRRSVISTATDGSIVSFPSQIAAERRLAKTGKQSAAVHQCLVGKKKTAYRYTWKRA